MTDPQTLPELPNGYAWAEHRHPSGFVLLPRVRAPWGGFIEGYGETHHASIDARASAAVRSSQWLALTGSPHVPDGVDSATWWSFVTAADASIYPHCLSQVETATDWRLFANCGLTRGAIAIYTDRARAGLAKCADALFGNHADAWLQSVGPASRSSVAGRKSPLCGSPDGPKVRSAHGRTPCAPSAAGQSSTP